MELSKRMYAVASLVTTGNRIVDIGTDHAYIPIFLIQEQRIPSAIAMDVNEGPLMRAEEHIQEYALEDRIETRLSDGFRKLKVGEADSAIIAGMGGNLVMRILKEHWNITCSLKECILQPQSEIAKVRAFLLEEGFLFIEEDMVLDDEKYYPMMKVVPPSQKRNTESWTETQLRFGKLLLEKQHPVLYQYLQREERIHRQILKSLESKDGERIEQRKKELEEELLHIREGLEYYEV